MVLFYFASYLTVYRNVKGEWLIEVDIINTVTNYPEPEEDEPASGDKRSLVKKIMNLLQKRSETPGVQHRRGI